MGGDELAIKRAGVDAIKPKTMRGCQREIKGKCLLQNYIDKLGIWVATLEPTKIQIYVSGNNQVSQELSNSNVPV